jgi:hypothetical protein
MLNTKNKKRVTFKGLFRVMFHAVIYQYNTISPQTLLSPLQRVYTYVYTTTHSLSLFLLSSKSRRRRADATGFPAPSSNDALVDGRFDAVVHFEIEFGKLVFLVGRGFLNVTQRRGIDNVSNNETLNGLVLGNGFSGRHAPNALDVTASVLVATVIASLDSHFCLLL